jgi:hypothetical protein
LVTISVGSDGLEAGDTVFCAVGTFIMENHHAQILGFAFRLDTRLE